MRFHLYVAVVAIVMLFSCDKDPYPGYTELDSKGLHYKVLRFQEDAPSPEQGDVIRFRMSRVEDESVVWQDSEVQMMRRDTLKSGLKAEIGRFHVGDSISFMMGPEAYRVEFGEYPDPRDRVSDIRMRVVSIVPEADWLLAVAIDQAEKAEKEELILKRFFSTRSDSSAFIFDQGIWTRVISSGDEAPFVAGEELMVMYTASLLDGTIIDDRSTPDQALSYSIGMQGQLIPGLVAAIKNMQRGQDLDLIIPSPMAFGEKGSAGDIVPPWTPVRYLLKVALREEVLP